MAVSPLHILHQGAMLSSLGRTAFYGIRQKYFPQGGFDPEAPGEEIVEILAPRAPALVADYIRAVGGDGASYRKVLPPHFFPQWVLPVAAKTLANVPYPMSKVLNGGCKMEINGPLPNNEPLEVRASIDRIEDKGKIVIIHQKTVTSTKSAPEALVAHLRLIVPNPEAKRESNDATAKKKPKSEALVPGTAQELDYWSLKEKTALDFAYLTGDFNPVHWVPSYAKALGFRNVILHGFATMARVFEGINRHILSGAASSISEFEVRFTKPLVLPHKVGLFHEGGHVFVGDTAGGPAYLQGNFRLKKEGSNG